jgi:hypothetical protein
MAREARIGPHDGRLTPQPSVPCRRFRRRAGRRSPTRGRGIRSVRQRPARRISVPGQPSFAIAQ